MQFSSGIKIRREPHSFAAITDGKMPEQKFGEYMIKYRLMDQVGQKPNKDGLAVKQAFFTRKADALYAITPGWPGPKLVLRNVQVPGSSVVTMLGVSGALKHEVKGNTLTIDLPALGAEDVPCRYAYTFKITGAKVLPEVAK